MAKALLGTMAIPFSSVEEAWFWTMAAVLAREDGAGLCWRPDGPDRPCDPEDILSSVNSLYNEGKFTLAHARVIRSGGVRQASPPSVPGIDHRLWHHAMGLLEWRLRGQGIVR